MTDKPMTVGEIRAKLGEFDDDLKVCVSMPGNHLSLVIGSVKAEVMSIDGKMSIRINIKCEDINKMFERENPELKKKQEALLEKIKIVFDN